VFLRAGRRVELVITPGLELCKSGPDQREKDSELELHAELEKRKMVMLFRMKRYLQETNLLRSGSQRGFKIEDIISSSYMAGLYFRKILASFIDPGKVLQSAGGKGLLWVGVPFALFRAVGVLTSLRNML
jgi:hypothetical protein